MNHDAVTDRLEHHLRDAARTAPLRPGSEVSVVRTARRRSARRRQVTAAASVVAVGGVGVLGLQQLTATSGSEIRTGSVPGGPGAPPPASPDPVGGRTIAEPVEFVAPTLVWRVVSPDTAEAVGTTPWNRQGAQFPGVLLSTAPGRSPDAVPQLWRSDDGITFTPTGTLPADRSLSTMVGLGDRLYAFGTAPGVAASESNPLLASISSDGGNTWDEAVLPVDANRAAGLPGIVDTSTYVSSASITPDGVLLVVAYSAQVDLAAHGIDTWMNQTREGVVVPSAECGSGDVVATTSVIGPGGIGHGGEPGYACPTELRTWEQIGLPAETAAALREPRERLLFSDDGAAFVELTLPSGTAEHVVAPSGRHHVVVVMEADGSRHLYRLAADRTWEALPDHPGGPGTVTDLDGRLVVVSGRFSESTGAEEVLVSTLGDDGTWTSVDVGGDEVAARSAVNVTNGRPGILVSAISVAAGDDQDAATTTTVTVPTGGPTTTAPPAGGMPTWELLHSFDGRAWSKQSIAEIAGVSPERISSITRIAGVDDHFIVTVTLNSNVSLDADPDAVPEQLVLIGTLAG